MADAGVQTEHERIANDSSNTKNYQSSINLKLPSEDFVQNTLATAYFVDVEKDSSVSDVNSFKKIHLSDGNVEYDDEAILIFNPELQRAIERRRCSILNDSRHSESRNIKPTFETKFASGDKSAKSENIEVLTESILADLRKGIFYKVQKVSDNLKAMRNNTATLKTGFVELEKHVKMTTLRQSRILMSANAHVRDLHLVIYQQNIIKHLEDAAKQMKLFECRVTQDRKLIMVDPEDFGTDVDAQAPVTDFRANLIVDREFHVETNDAGNHDTWDLF